MLRDARRRRSTTASRTGGGSRPGRSRAVDHTIEPDLSNAAPFLAPGCGHRRVRSPSATGRARPPRPATRCADLLGRMGCERELADDGPARSPAPATLAGHRRRPARRRRADPGRRRAVRAGRTRRRTCAASRTSAATRPTGSPRWPPSSARWAPTSPSAPTASSCGPAAAARRAVPHLRRPPDGARRRRPRLRPSTASQVDEHRDDRARRSPTSPRSGRGSAGRPMSRPLRRERPRALRAPPPPHPAAHQGAAPVRRRRRRRGHHRRPRPAHAAGRRASP